MDWINDIMRFEGFWDWGWKLIVSLIGFYALMIFFALFIGKASRRAEKRDRE